MASHFYEWHHGRIHYHKRGMGDPIVLLHNAYPGASFEEYGHNIPELARHFTVYAPDLLGFGDSDMPRIKYTAQTYIELIFDFLREAVGQPAHVVCAGLTAAYVTEVAAWRANLFRRLVYVCPRSEPTGLDSPRWFAPVRHFFLSTPTLGSGFYETMAGETEMRGYLRDCLHNPRAITDGLVKRLVENARQPGSIHAYASLITGYLDWSLLGSLPKVEVPILLVWGRQAKPTPVEHSVRLVSVARRCKLEVIEEAGAWVHREQSAKVNRLIVDYCDGESVDDLTASRAG
jgi:pimeloyl-ACP methyl ester carboxylesterase